MFELIVRCPVCKKQIDTMTSSTPEPNGMGAALVLSDSRRAHGVESPQCVTHRDWVHGWDFDPPVEIPDPPKPKPSMNHYGTLKFSWRYCLDGVDATTLDKTDLDAHAVARAIEMRAQGFREGELCYSWGDREIRGWWSVEEGVGL